MATIAEKDILIEENAFIMATCDKNDTKSIKKCQNLRNFLYANDERLIDFKGTLEIIEKIKRDRDNARNF